jgi:membrane protease YdiL (CAAX protease family)
LCVPSLKKQIVGVQGSLTILQTGFIMIFDKLNDFFNFFKYGHGKVFKAFRIKDFVFWTVLNFIIGELLLSSFIRLFERKGFISYSDKSHFDDSFFIFLAVIMAPLFEEVIFRYPLKFLPSNVTIKRIGIFISTILFAFIHVYSYTLHGECLFASIIVIVLSPFYGGIVLSYIRLSYGLWAAIITHMSYNILALIYSYIYG